MSPRNTQDNVLIPGVAAPEIDNEELGTLTQPEPQPQPVSGAAAALWAVIFAGGIGSRFWPLSSPERPKQLLSLLGERPLIADTVARLAPIIPPERILVVTSADIAAPMHAAIPEVPESNMLVEPRPLGTAASLAWGAREVERRAGPSAVLCAIHADLAVAFPDAFRHSLQRAAGLAAQHSALVSIAVAPTRPDTSFGYVLPGVALDFEHGDTAGARWARSFVEKPGEILASQLISEGGQWHSGMLVCSAKSALDGLTRHATELAEGLPALRELDMERFAGMIRSVSIERGLLERCDRLAVIVTDCGWDDVGTWASLRRARELDDNGNGAVGKSFFVDASSNVVHAEGGTVVLFGVSRLLVVCVDGLTFVTTLDRAGELKPLLDALPGSLRLKPGG
jgi:mannose-1-phosphate guanylyltransferase